MQTRVVNEDMFAYADKRYFGILMTSTAVSALTFRVSPVLHSCPTAQWGL